MSDPRFQEYVEPRSDTEKSICQIWQEFLRVPRVGLNDNFFDLGGDSVNATQVVARLREVLSVSVPLRSIFEMATVGKLAHYVESLRWFSAPGGETEGTVEEGAL